MAQSHCADSPFPHVVVSPSAVCTRGAFSSATGQILHPGNLHCVCDIYSKQWCIFRQNIVQMVGHKVEWPSVPCVKTSSFGKVDSMFVHNVNDIKGLSCVCLHTDISRLQFGAASLPGLPEGTLTHDRDRCPS